jgi:hypothetical protein
MVTKKKKRKRHKKDLPGAGCVGVGLASPYIS